MKTRGTELVGLVRIRNCCVFTWREWRASGQQSGDRIVDITAEHCEACIAELRRTHPELRLIAKHRGSTNTPQD